MKWTAAAVLDALREAYGITGSNLVTEEWAFLTEVPLRAVEAKYVNRYTANTRTIDALLIRNWTGGTGHERLAVEVKISRSDYKNETDAKRLPAEQAAHRCTYAAPAGLIDPTTLPPGWGLIEVYDTHGEAHRAAGGWAIGGTRCRWRVRATRRDPVCDLDYLVSAVARKGSRTAEVLRRGETDAAEVARLRADVERLAQQVQRRDDALVRERKRLRQARDMLAAVDGSGTECADCESPLRWDHRRASWAHTDDVSEARCLRTRQERVQARQQARTGSAYLLGYADPIEPKSLRAQREREDQADAAP